MPRTAKQKPSVFLTVDWDAFVPEKLEWDLGHQESNLFISDMWGLRGQFIDLIKTSGEEQGFWPRVLNHFTLHTNGVVVTDSHVYAYERLQRAPHINTVVNFDAHHDCWPLKDDKVGCATWGRAWLEDDQQHRMVWVVPDWQDRSVWKVDHPRVKAMSLSTFERDWGDLPRAVGSVHICRSGCWTPPWLDEAFIEFVKGSGLQPLSYPASAKGTPWDAMQPRWKPEDVEAAKERDARTRAAQNEFMHTQQRQRAGDE